MSKRSSKIIGCKNKTSPMVSIVTLIGGTSSTKKTSRNPLLLIGSLFDGQGLVRKKWCCASGLLGWWPVVTGLLQKMHRNSLNY